MWRLGWVRWIGGLDLLFRLVGWIGDLDWWVGVKVRCGLLI